MTKEVRGWIYRFFWFSAFLAMSLALVTFNKEQNHFFNGKWPIEQQSSNELGILGSWIAGFLLSFFGYVSWLYVVWFLYEMFSGQKKSLLFRFLSVNLWVFWLSLVPWFSYNKIEDFYISYWMTPKLKLLFGNTGYWIFWFFGFAFLMLVSMEYFSFSDMHFTIKNIFKDLLAKSFGFRQNTYDKINKIKPIKNEIDIEQVITVNQESENQNLKQFKSEKKEPFDKKQIDDEVKDIWRIPALSHWAQGRVSSSKDLWQEDFNEKKQALIQKLETFNIKGEILRIRQGPALLLIEYKPNDDVKLSRISDLKDDLQLALRSESVRILAPIPGQDVVGFEVAKTHRDTVYLTDLLNLKEGWAGKMKLGFVLGKRITGEPAFDDLRRLVHMMVAGTTGSGKSQFILSLLSALISQHTPRTLRLVLIDPKQVEFGSFDGLPHLAGPVAKNAQQAFIALQWAVEEMEKRYQAMSLIGCRQLEEFNFRIVHENTNVIGSLEQKGLPHSLLPYVVIVIDELADLMMLDKMKCESAIIRLAQKARACGIHLVLGLQSPRREFLTGAIKSNIPARLAFKTATALESRLIIDEAGAQLLLGQGDFLMKSPYHGYPVRYHGPYVAENELNRLLSFWKEQPPSNLLYDFNESSQLKNLDSNPSAGNISNNIPIEVIDWIKNQTEVSASLIQRRFSMGYPRASRIIDQLAEAGFIVKSPKDKAWKVDAAKFREKQDLLGHL